MIFLHFTYSTQWNRFENCSLDQRSSFKHWGEKLDKETFASAAQFPQIAFKMNGSWIPAQMLSLQAQLPLAVQDEVRPDGQYSGVHHIVPTWALYQLLGPVCVLWPNNTAGRVKKTNKGKRVNWKFFLLRFKL